MKLKILITELIVLSLAVCTYAGYGDLKDAYDSYEPTPYYESQLQTAKKPTTSMSEDFINQDMYRPNTRQFQGSNKGKVQIARKVIGDSDPNLFTVLQSSVADSIATANFLYESYDLGTLTTMVILRNPGITAADKNYRAAIEKISQVTELDMVLRQYSAFTEGAMAGVGPMKGKDPVNMKFPFPGVTALKAQVAQQEIEFARLELEKSIRNAVAAAKKSFWNLHYVKQARVITREILTLLAHLEEVATTRYEAGKTSYQDVIKIRINKESLLERLVTLEESERNLEVSILTGVNLPIDTALGAPQAKPINASVPKVKVLFEKARKHRQELRQVQVKISKMEHMLELAETMILPPFTLNLSIYPDEAAMRVGTFNKMGTFPQTTAASRGAGLPKNPWYGSNDAYLRQIRQKIEALKAKRMSVEDNTIRIVQKAWFDLDKAKREESLYAQTIVDLSQTSLEVSTRGYESGKVMFADVFASYDFWFKARLSLERKRSDVGIHWAKLEKTVGIYLD